MGKLLNEVRIRGRTRTPELDLSQSRLRRALPLLILPLYRVSDRPRPRLHGGRIVRHQFLVLDIPLNIVANRHDGQLDGDRPRYLDRCVTDVRDELLQVFARLRVFALNGEVHLAEEETQDVQLVLNAAHHQVADAVLQLHSVTYLNKSNQLPPHLPLISI